MKKLETPSIQFEKTFKTKEDILKVIKDFLKECSDIKIIKNKGKVLYGTKSYPYDKIIAFTMDNRMLTGKLNSKSEYIFTQSIYDNGNNTMTEYLFDNEGNFLEENVEPIYNKVDTKEKEESLELLLNL